MTKGTTNKGLFITGAYGVGKTYLASCIANEIIKNGKSVIFGTLIQLLDFIRDSYSDSEASDKDYLNLYSSVDLLVIDDLGGENVTGWSRDEVLAAVLTYRNQNKKITLFTSQYTQDDLIKIYTLKKDAREKIKVERLLNTIFTMSMPIMIKQ